ncbi:MBL fold metallo-hydrolase [Pseudomonadales bacterium]|nr:MBL fold metallo-hydrolase [Pseudomonadales bacterium]
MVCELKILSHACLLVKTETSSVIVDPWLVGSCYWRSWWNFPEPVFDDAELEGVDAVIISHLHWDHWHGPTLKKYLRDKPVIVSDDPSLRSEKDLRSIGFSDISKMAHGISTCVGDIKITFYNFGLFLTDSAIVIETQGVTILNANDAKVAGLPLSHIISRHGPIDFALRSHSSANPRVCYEIPNDGSFINDDREHYFRSFKLFMDRVKPRYAIPFASNHCHLNYDGLKFNSYISDPVELRSFMENRFSNLPWSLQVMLPGSSWSSMTGFNLANESCFTDKDHYLKEYAAQVSNRIEFYKDREARVLISNKILEKFTSILKTSGACKHKGSIRFLITSPDSVNDLGFKVNEGEIVTVTNTSDMPEKNCPVIVMPNVVFRDATFKNMFHHAAISKRCRYIAFDQNDMDALKTFVNLLERYELTGDVSLNYIIRLCRSYASRWRELLVYVWALYLKKFEGLEMYQIEERILK